jgi:hypothetical protein
MTDIEFGIWMSENLELALQARADLDAAGELLPEDPDENIVINAAKLIGTLMTRYPDRFPDTSSPEGEA